MAGTRRRRHLCLDRGHVGLGKRVRGVRSDRRPVAILVIVVGKSNAKVSDGSQPPGASASPLGGPAGARSLNRLVRLNSVVLPPDSPPQAGRGQYPTESPSLSGSWSCRVGKGFRRVCGSRSPMAILVILVRESNDQAQARRTCDARPQPTRSPALPGAPGSALFRVHHQCPPSRHRSKRQKMIHKPNTAIKNGPSR